MLVGASVFQRLSVCPMSMSHLPYNVLVNKVHVIIVDGVFLFLHSNHHMINLETKCF